MLEARNGVLVGGGGSKRGVGGAGGSERGVGGGGGGLNWGAGGVLVAPNEVLGSQNGVLVELVA